MALEEKINMVNQTIVEVQRSLQENLSDQSKNIIDSMNQSSAQIYKDLDERCNNLTELLSVVRQQLIEG